MSNDPALVVTMEELVDAEGVDTLLNALEAVCRRKATHIIRVHRDVQLARDWTLRPLTILS